LSWLITNSSAVLQYIACHTSRRTTLRLCFWIMKWTVPCITV
jgi:hypothetical protein